MHSIGLHVFTPALFINVPEIYLFISVSHTFIQSSYVAHTRVFYKLWPANTGMHKPRPLEHVVYGNRSRLIKYKKLLVNGGDYE